jgi:hypothetical protein
VWCRITRAHDGDTSPDLLPHALAHLREPPRSSPSPTAQLYLADVAGTTIYYSVGDSADRSGEYTFVVPPAPGAATYPFKLLAWADQGLGLSDDSYNGALAPRAARATGTGMLWPA